MGKLLRYLLPVAIVSLGGLLFVTLSSMRSAPERVERVDLGPLVETLQPSTAPLQASVMAQGTVRPDREVDVVPQVSGVLEWVAPELEAGGFFAAGDVLARIETEDYELALAQARSEVERSRVQLQIEQGEADIARLEWERLHPDDEPDPLVLRQPQVRAAAATLRAAQARQREAELRLERTRLVAPFHGRVRVAHVDAGQFVAMGQPIARIYSIEKAQIVVPVPDHELAWIQIPSPENPVLQIASTDAEVADRQPPPVLITARYAGRDHAWQGRVVRSEGELDARSRMVRLVIEVSDPYGQITGPEPVDDNHAPLVVGLYCDVEIRGRQLKDVVALPRNAIHAEGEIWVVTPAGRLSVRRAQVVRTDRERGFVRVDLAPGEQIITSQLKGVTDGMRVRLAGTAATGRAG